MYSKEETLRFLREQVARPASAGIIVKDEQDRVLLVKAHYKNYWSFPGGWIEAGQTPVEAAIRELKEETGLEVSPESVNLAFVANRSSKYFQSYNFIFRSLQVIDSNSEIVLQPEEIAQCRFVPLEEVLDDDFLASEIVKQWAKCSDLKYYEQKIEL